MNPRLRHAPVPARLRVTRRALQTGLRGLGGHRLRRTRASARGLVDLLGEFVAQGITPLAAALGADAPQAWQQYALDDARMRRAGALFYYYHSHAPAPRSEHGHFHVFRSLADRGAGAQPVYSHLVGIGVDGRGLPQRLFTTNRWVTDECWRDAPDGIAALSRLIAARHGDATLLARWLRGVLTVFFPQIALLMLHRDRRVALHGGAHVLDDRRMCVLSECKVSLAAQMQALDSVAH